jgi:flagellum-specific peptidoglycan hydrolase FlgJ
LIKKSDSFNSQKLVAMMKGLNIKFAWIPMAQSIVETGHWKSNIFVENNNLFGMKEAKQRVTTADGTQNNHAYYESWKESVYDYAFYQSRYLGSIKSEQEYFEYLSASYAEDPNYIRVLKATIEKYKLKEQFK